MKSLLFKYNYTPGSNDSLLLHYQLMKATDGYNELGTYDIYNTEAIKYII